MFIHMHADLAQKYSVGVQEENSFFLPLGKA
jgi:hypothetical protein